MQYKFYNVINDELRGGETTHQAVDPRTEELLWPTPVATAQDFEDAVNVAQKAFPAWSQSTNAERQKVLRRLADVIKDNQVLLSEIIMKETGKSSLMAAIECGNSIQQTLYYSTVGLEDEIQFEDDTIKIIATHTPLGVVGAISPWNFPLILSSIKVISALLTGNCVIVKPSPFTPYAVAKWIELSIGIVPPGVLQVVNGGADLGSLMTLHPGVAKISFTGTIATGKKVMAACAKTLKKVTLELAGNDAAIVCPDVSDLAYVAQQTAGGSFFNAGQMCVATKRIYVHDDVYDRFLELYLAEVEKNFPLVEDASVPCPFGPVSTKMQFDIVKDIIEDCNKRGFNVAAIGGGGSAVLPAKGFWIPPTVVTQPPDDSLLVKEEQFGPVIPILRWSSEDDVIKRANLPNAGLGASVYTSDLERAERIARRLESGTVWINKSGQPHAGGFFGGQKDSGFGGEMGKQGLLSYCYTQSLQFAKSPLAKV